MAEMFVTLGTWNWLIFGVLLMALELLAPVSYKAQLRETPVPGDATSEQTENVLPPYVIYGADGDVTGELVYDPFEAERNGEVLPEMTAPISSEIVG